MNSPKRQRPLSLLAASLLAAWCSAPQSASANNWDLINVHTAHADISYDFNGQTADAGSLRYLARFLRAAERLPEGVAVLAICFEDTTALHFDEDMLATATAEERSLLQEQAANVQDERPLRHFSRLRTCLAQAARKVRRAFPNFRPASESAEWYALAVDDLAAVQHAGEEGTLFEDGNAFTNGVAQSNSALAGPTEPFGFFLTRAAAESASGNLATPQRMHRRADATLVCHPFY